MDLGHNMTEDILADLERRLAEEYRRASAEIEKKLREFLDQFAAQDEIQRELLRTGNITAKEYSEWRFRHMMMNKRWEEMRNTLAEEYHRANQIAASIYRSERAGIYALNHNYALYNIEHSAGIDTGLTLYNRDAVERILTQNPKMLPPPGKKVSKRIAEGKDILWNNRQIQSVMVQGILQGESIPKLARRLEQVTERNYTAAVRNARTMATGAQNAGRREAYERAESVGVHLLQEWVATLDNRTRHEHRQLHGQRVPIDEPFKIDGYEIWMPGDPTAPGYLVWNCRCTTLSWVKGFEGETVTTSTKMGYMSFGEWLEAKPHPDTQADRDQFDEYRKLLGKDAPSSYNAFRDLKYNSPREWDALKNEARMERAIRKAPCELTKRKFSDYFLKPGAKHSEEFFAVGYTEKDVRRLRYDMARQFDLSKALMRKVRDNGAETFNILMQLGITKTRPFQTGWIIDAPGEKPRIVTGYRVSTND